MKKIVILSILFFLANNSNFAQKVENIWTGNYIKPLQINRGENIANIAYILVDEHFDIQSQVYKSLGNKIEVGKNTKIGMNSLVSIQNFYLGIEYQPQKHNPFIITIKKSQIFIDTNKLDGFAILCTDSSILSATRIASTNDEISFIINGNILPLINHGEISEPIIGVPAIKDDGSIILYCERKHYTLYALSPFTITNKVLKEKVQTWVKKRTFDGEFFDTTTVKELKELSDTEKAMKDWQDRMIPKVNEIGELETLKDSLSLILETRAPYNRNKFKKTFYLSPEEEKMIRETLKFIDKRIKVLYAECDILMEESKKFDNLKY